MKKILPFLFALLISNVCFAQTYVNGSVLTGTSTYSGVTNPTVGYQWSEVAYDAPNTTYSSTNAGYSCNRTSSNTGFRLADDFVIPAGEKWTINTVEFLAYQTGYAGVTSPFNEIYVEIWNGAPNVVGSTIVFGDMVTNRFSSSSEIFAHRIFNTVAPSPGTASGTTRRIWKTIANANVTLCSGTYWVVFQTGINNASVYSLHFAPPVTLPNVRAVPGANALQYNESSSTWIPSIDAGNPTTATDENIAIPFTVNYTDANPLTITASPNTAVCLGSNITLTAGGATAPYTWSSGISDGVPFQLNANSTYTVSAVDGSGCNVSKSVDVTTIALPPVTASSIPVTASVCDGGSVTLSGGGATTYTWSGPVPVSDNTPFIANATAAGTYTVTGSDGTCSSTATIQLTVNPLPTVTATSIPSPAIVCQGGSVTLNGGGATSYTWTDGVNIQTDGVAFFPSASSIYTVTGTDAGCSSTATIAVTVNTFQTPPSAPTPEILYYKFDGSGTTVPNLALTPPAGTANATIMGGITQGGSGLFGGGLNGTGVASSSDYLNTGWAPNLGTGSWTIAFWSSGISTNTTLYYIFGDVNSNGFRCFTNGVAGSTNWILRGAGLTDITLPGGALSTPTMNVYVYDATANNVKAYMNGVLVNTVAQGTPNITGTGPFKVMGYSTNVGAPVGGMLDEFRVYNRALTPAEIATLPLPPIVFEATASPAAICAGASSTLTATGASSYTWQPGGMTGSSVNVSPTATTIYTITGTDAGGCTSVTTVTVTINTPTVVANATPSSTVCDGTSITLYGSGASSYTWAGPIAITDNTPFTANVASAGTYTVTGTNAGCSSTATIVVSISSPSIITATVSPNDTVCSGIPITLSGAGGVTYTWNSIPTLTSDTTLIPASAATYTVVGTDAGGCTGSATISISFSSTPIFVDDFETGSLSPAWQSGTGSYTATVVNTNPAEGSYNLKLSSTTGNAFYQGRYVTFPSAQPTYVSWWARTNTTNAANGYFVLGDNNIGSNNGILFAYFNATSSLRFFNTAGYNHPIVANQWYFIEARNIDWTAKTMDIYVDNVLILPGWAFRTPTSTSVTQFHLHSLSAADPEYDKIQIGAGNIVPLVATVSPASTVCAGSPISLHAAGAMNYMWNGLSVPSGDTSLIPAASSVYTVTANDSYGCTASRNVSVTVNPSSGTIAPITSNQSQQHGDDFNIHYSDASCNLIATVDDGFGGNILGATTATVNVEPNAGMHNNQPYVRRWYQITPSSNGSADVVLYINQTDFDDYNAMVTAPYLPLPTSGNNADPNIANIRITKNSDAGLGNSPVVITPTVNWNGTFWELSFNTPSFSQFRIHSVNPNNVPLPVTLTQFKGRMVSSHDELTWTTNAEYQNDYFNLQHSTDGQHFTTIEKVMSKAVNGHSEQELNYVVNHSTPKAGHNYYRLQQVDRDGKLSTNAQVVDLYRSNLGNEVSIYPNPVKDILHIELYASQSQNNTIKLIDMSGRLVKQLQVSSVSGVNNLELNLTDVASGIYTIEVYANDHMMHVSRIRKSN